jgi:hypothetical protein
MLAITSTRTALHDHLETLVMLRMVVLSWDQLGANLCAWSLTIADFEYAGLHRPRLLVRCSSRTPHMLLRPSLVPAHFYVMF